MEVVEPVCECVVSDVRLDGRGWKVMGEVTRRLGQSRVLGRTLGRRAIASSGISRGRTSMSGYLTYHSARSGIQ